MDRLSCFKQKQKKGSDVRDLEKKRTENYKIAFHIIKKMLTSFREMLFILPISARHFESSSFRFVLTCLVSVNAN